MSTTEKLVNNLRQIRRGKSILNQQELAKQVGCTRQTIIALEQNKYNPSLMLALKLAKTLGVSVEEIFRIQD